ncbi:ABC transporter permease [Capnocytophaga sp. ARDL2]|uniref:ABC transporter permease n=1 Tax=Capnocytophaga sp. ARDL2 TaxID=3238809 RepID=UPI003556F7DB
MSILSLIIKREFISKVRNKSFIVMTFLSPLLMAALVGLVVFLSTQDPTDKKNIAICDETGWFQTSFESDDAYHYTYFPTYEKEVMKQGLEEETYQGILHIPKFDDLKKYENGVEYISEESPSMRFIDDVEYELSKVFSAKNYLANGIDTMAMHRSKVDVSMNMQKSSGETTVKGINEIKGVLGSILGYMIMMFIIVYGNMVMRSVIEEKVNRIIEVIISSVKPYQLMLGKIIGASLAGILQFIIWGVCGGILMLILSIFMQPTTPPVMPVGAGEELVGLAENQDTIQMYIAEILQLPFLELGLSFLVFFIFGYFLYSAIYAAIGAAVDNETDSQQFLMPVIAPLILGVYIGAFTVINDPHGTTAVVFSMIPFTSPIVMMMRIPFGVPFYQIALSVLILIATFAAIVYIAAKIYRVGILMYGKKASWKEMLKWLKY